MFGAEQKPDDVLVASDQKPNTGMMGVEQADPTPLPTKPQVILGSQQVPVDKMFGAEQRPNDTVAAVNQMDSISQPTVQKTLLGADQHPAEGFVGGSGSLVDGVDLGGASFSGFDRDPSLLILAHPCPSLRWGLG